MSDAATVLVALAAALGALAARPVPLVVAALAVAAALTARWPALLGVGVALAASGLAARSWAGLDPPQPRQIDGVLTLASDPVHVSGALRVDVRIGRRHVEAWARGRAAAALRDRLAGERVKLTGHLEPVPETERRRLAPRHVSGRLTVDAVGASSAGTVATRIANGLRRTLLAGAESLPPDQRSLFAGFVLGDDRNQPPELAYDFRASGLTHLLVVSGENVAFVLALAGPLLRRLGLRGRLAAGLVLLFLFGTLTRWEPSVLRAVAMASVSLLAATLGRPASTFRLVALAVSGLLLVDPLLVHSVGFRLSVGACSGIALLSRPLTRLLPGPRALAGTLAVTLAAQAGVAPVMIPAFGSLPVSGLVANVLALPAAGPLMVWGLAAGFPAGLGRGPLATVVHIPTRLLLAWVAAVARTTAALPVGDLRLGPAIALATGAAATALGLLGRRRWMALSGAGACLVALLLPSVALFRPAPADARPIGRGATLWRAGGATVLVLDGAGGSPDRLMSALRRHAVRRLDVLVASRAGATEASMAEQLQHRFPAGLVLGPPRSRLPNALVPPPGTEIRLGHLAIRVEHDHDRLAVSVSPAAPTTPTTRTTRAPRATRAARAPRAKGRDPPG